MGLFSTFKKDWDTFWHSGEPGRRMDMNCDAIRRRVAGGADINSTVDQGNYQYGKWQDEYYADDDNWW